MTTYTLPQPATTYPFKPGEAVYYAKDLGGGMGSTPALFKAQVVKPAKPGPFCIRDAPHVGIVLEDGRRTSVKGFNLVYQGYCQDCRTPAVLDGKALLCPQCGEPATPTPPPPALVLRWYPIYHDRVSQWVHTWLTTDCTYKAAMDMWRDHYHEAFYNMLDKHYMRREMYDRRGPWEEGEHLVEFVERMHWYAELGDEESFLAYYRAHTPTGELPIERTRRGLEALGEILDILGDGPGGPSRRLQLPPLTIERSADDSEPDGEDETTAWLRHQFRRRAA